ncbi:MAG: hypothetical protein PHU77_03040 [Simplicispira sp.]|nr:hypothetical protein [Simplicispira sp.]
MTKQTVFIDNHVSNYKTTADSLEADTQETLLNAAQSRNALAVTTADSGNTQSTAKNLGDRT